MFGRPKSPAIKLAADEDVVKSLKSAVQKVEALVARENELKREIERKKKEYELLQKKFQNEKLKFEKERKSLKESSFRLEEERDKLCTRLKEKKDDEKEIIELKRKNCELECAKLKAKTDADVYERRIKELEIRVLMKNLEEKNASVKLTTAKTNPGKIEVSEDSVESEETSDVSEDTNSDDDDSDDQVTRSAGKCKRAKIANYTSSSDDSSSSSC